MNSGKLIVFLFFLITTPSNFAQYVQYPSYYSNYGGSYPSYPVSNDLYSYRSPCRSSCGSIQPTYTSYCQHLPCNIQQQRPSYLPYPYSSSYSGFSNNNRRIVNGPYGNYYPNIQTINTNLNENIPVEVVDDDSVTSRRALKTLPVTSLRRYNPDEYANVPIEIIDVDPKDFYKNIPKLPKVVTSSNNTYSVSNGVVTNENTSQSKPVKATITRTFQPIEPNKEIKLDFFNGELVDSNKKSDVTETTEVPTTTLSPATTEEDTEVSEVRSWFS